jgi:hypothetical protein
MADWTTHAAMLATALGVLALERLRARRKARARSDALAASIAPLEMHVSSDGLLKALVFQDVGSVLRVNVYALQDDGPFGRPWIPIATSFADREALPGVLRDSLNGEYT